MANTLTFNQISTVLNSIVKQATGQITTATATTTSEFVAQANTALLTGYDNVINSISQVLDRTIFSTRPYTAKLTSIRKDNRRFGNHVRKLTMVDDDWTNDDRLPLDDGSTVDMYTINKGKVLQTNFYGGQVFQRSRTYFKDQLDVAFRSPDELANFISMYTQNTVDQIEQCHEVMSRMTLVNLIASKIKADAGNVIHLLTEYNTLTGLELTAQTVRQPENYQNFSRWLYSRIKTLSDMFTERSQKFHLNIANKPVQRHTPYRMQNLYLYGGEMNSITAQVVSMTRQDDKLKLMNYETVNFWQSINEPMTIKVNPSYISATGEATASDTEVTSNVVFGILCDEESMGLTTINQWSMPTPMNARGGYYNMFYHFTDRYYNDMTENAIVLLMD